MLLFKSCIYIIQFSQWIRYYCYLHLTDEEGFSHLLKVTAKNWRLDSTQVCLTIISCISIFKSLYLSRSHWQSHYWVLLFLMCFSLLRDQHERPSALQLLKHSFLERSHWTYIKSFFPVPLQMLPYCLIVGTMAKRSLFPYWKFSLTQFN